MNTSNIKVSIIVPIYNVEKYLNQCIESIINQTYRNLEIILVDDGSLDNSGKIADDFAKRDSRIKVIHNDNEGVSAARNKGIDIATGEYVCFADADDYLMSDYVEYLLNLIIENSADISLTKEMFTTFYINQIKQDKKEIYSAEEALIDILSYNIPIGVYCKMFKRTFLSDKIRFIPNIFIGEGFNFNTTAFQRANKVAIGRRKIYFYRRNNPTSATTKFSLAKWKNAIYAIENIYNNLIICTPEVKIAWQYANWHTYCDAFNFMIMAKNEKNHLDEFKCWKKIVRSKAFYAFRVKIIPKERIRAIIMFFCPKLMPWMIRQRNKHHFN